MSTAVVVEVSPVRAVEAVVTQVTSVAQALQDGVHETLWERHTHTHTRLLFKQDFKIKLSYITLRHISKLVHFYPKRRSFRTAGVLLNPSVAKNRPEGHLEKEACERCIDYLLLCNVTKSMWERISATAVT